jgi:hypothetical protein
MVESVWRQRLRWRLRGAWQWPAFAALTVVDAALAAWLPWTGEGADAIGAFLFAAFVNLIAIAVLAPFRGMALRRRRRDLPFMIARDYAATGLLVFIGLALLAGGVLHRSALNAERADERAVLVAVHTYLSTENPRLVPALETLDSRKLEDDNYRACIFPPHERLPLCFFVNTNQSPAGITRDPTRATN